MRNLISTKPERVILHMGNEAYSNHCGCLRSPLNPSYIDDICRKGYAWGCDNDCFSGYNPRRIARFLDRFQDYAPQCLFFNVPDYLTKINGRPMGNAKETLARFKEWEPLVRRLGWKAAFTLQDGMEDHFIPWDDCDALFIGSSDDYRYGAHRVYVQERIHEARERGKWVHVGRVNSIRRIEYWRNVGANSFDGTGFVTEPLKAFRLLPFHAFPVRQLTLFHVDMNQ